MMRSPRWLLGLALFGLIDQANAADLDPKANMPLEITP